MKRQIPSRKTPDKPVKKRSYSSGGYAPNLYGWYEDIAMFSVPSNRSSEKYYPCIQVGGDNEVICSCPYYHIKIEPMCERENVGITSDQTLLHCRHITGALKVLSEMSEEELEESKVAH